MDCSADECSKDWPTHYFTCWLIFDLQVYLKSDIRYKMHVKNRL